METLYISPYEHGPGLNMLTIKGYFSKNSTHLYIFFRSCVMTQFQIFWFLFKICNSQFQHCTKENKLRRRRNVNKLSISIQTEFEIFSQRPSSRRIRRFYSRKYSGNIKTIDPIKRRTERNSN